MAVSFSVFNKFKAVDDVSKPIKNMTNKVDRFGDRSQRAFRRADRGAGKLVNKLKALAAIAATVVGITAITQQLTSAVMIGAEFEQTIVNASAKFGDSAARGTKNFKLMEDAARKAGATTEFTASQAADGLNFLALAGFNVEQSISALPNIIDLATAAQVELGLASDIATDTLGAFNLQTKDAIQLQKNLTRVTDVMAKTTTRSNTNMEQLFEVFTEAGPVATSLGASIETVAAMAGRLADAGIKASQGGTVLKNVFLRLAAATPEAQKQLKKLNIQLKDSATGGFRDVLDIMGDLNGALSELDDVERAGVLNDIFGKIPIAGVNVLLKTGTENLKGFRTELENAAGATAEMAKKMRDTRLAQFKTLLSAIESVKISVFVAIDRVLGNVTGKIIELTRQLDTWLQTNRSLVDNVLSTFVGVLGSIFDGLSGVIKMVTDANALFNGFLIPAILGLVGAMKAWAAIQGIINILMTANPLGAFIVALVAVSAGIKAVIDNWDNLVDDFKRGAEFVKGLLSRFFGAGKQTVEVKGSRGDNVPMSPNTPVLRSMREERQNNSVDVNFNNLPPGAEVAGSGGPGVTINTGYSGAF